jgi:type I restriction enzyme, S subunit
MSEVISKFKKLPSNWKTVKIADISNSVRGVSYKKSDSKKTPKINFVGILRSTNIASKLSFDELVYVPQKYIDDEQIIKKNDVIISMSSGSKHLVGKSAQSLDDTDVSFGTFCMCIRPSKIMCGSFIGYYFQSSDFKKYVQLQSVGVNINNLRREHIENLEISIPSLNEQKRIAKKIEELFSLIDVNLDSLTNIQNQLIGYEKSLLFSVFGGEFTNEWRIHNSEINGKETLENSLKQRNHLWDEKEKSSKTPRKYSQPIRPSLTNLPQIPDAWVWASFEEVSERVTVGFVGSMKNEYVEIGIPFLRSQNVRKNRYDKKGLKSISPKFHKKISKSQLSPNDIVTVRSGDVGVSCVIPEILKDSNCSDLLIVKNPLGINPHFGAYYLNSIRSSRVRQQQVGIALTHFNTKSLAKMAIPVPSIEEQNLMVMNIQMAYSFIDNTRMILNQTMNKLLVFKQSILKQAFEGKLVPQDPNDEVDVLLQKIKQEKEQLIQKTKRKSKNVK